MIAGKNILVAGGTGLVGANLTKRLKELGANVRATYFSKNPGLFPELFVKADFTELSECVEVSKGMDTVFICAAQTFGAKIMNENPTALILPNLRINSGLLEACRLNRVEKVVFISSSTVYQEAFYPIREDELDLNKPTYELYQGVGWMKRYIEQLCRFYAKRYGMKIGIVRPTNIYGPYDKFDAQSAHVLPALINRALMKESPYVVWGDGYTVRDFIYVDDFIDDLLNVLDRYCVCDPLNVSSGGTLTIREAVGVILKVCGHKVDPQYDPSKPNAIPYRALNTTKFNSIFGTKSRTSFTDGISKTVAWFRESQAVGSKN
ncbi:MAG: GDP-L-fucose synthase [Elusimicrobia bacterium]|nr:GDP-L-fucose synthase [Elusimicrobiota bacterium]